MGTDMYEKGTMGTDMYEKRTMGTDMYMYEKNGLTKCINQLQTKVCSCFIIEVSAYSYIVTNIPSNYPNQLHNKRRMRNAVY